MPRACVIVLDAVGAGELPDADEYGDAGSNTLGNVARAVGGLDLPNLEALGFGNIEPLEGCPPQPGAPAVAGRLIERRRGCLRVGESATRRGVRLAVGTAGAARSRAVGRHQPLEQRRETLSIELEERHRDRLLPAAIALCEGAA